MLISASTSQPKAPDTRCRSQLQNRLHRPKFDPFFRADARLQTSLTAGPKAVDNVRSRTSARKMAPESGVEFMAPISGVLELASGACVRGLTSVYSSGWSEQLNGGDFIVDVCVPYVVL